MNTAADPLLGTQVGSYQISHVIGQGGMGRVYAAVDPAVGSRVAIKVINEEYARDRDLCDRFFAEARAVNFIRHENIVKVIDLLTLPDGRPVIVMELIEGTTLRDLVRVGPTPLGSVAHVMIDVLSALAAAHAAGIIHRDLKPDNILVTASGRAKVLDFGIAKLTRPLPPNAPRTRTGAVLGTPEYMAPEQISGGRVDARTDVYAAGVVLFEALTGRRPFDGPSDFEVMRAHVDLSPPSARSIRAAIPAEIENVIATALAKNPLHRFANATAMATALHGASAVLASAEWRAFVPGGRAFVRTPVAPVAPTMHASMIGFAPEQSGSLPTRSDRPTPTDAPTLIKTPRGVSAPRGRPSWVMPILGAIAVATLAIVIAIAVRGRSRSPSRTSAGSGSGFAVGVDADSFEVLRVPLTFDPRRYDPVAFYPEALKLAQRLMPDARLVTFDAHDFDRDGYVDLTIAKPKYNGFAFRSASGANANVESKLLGRRTCYVMLTLTPTHVEVFAAARTASECDRPIVSPPRCSFADIISRTPVPGTNLSFRLGSNGRPQWFLDDKLKIDDCPAPRSPAIEKPANE